MNYYDVLGVPQNATAEQIKKAYREQIRFFHPDVFEGSEDVSRIKTLQLNEAYEVLKDPVRRKLYDSTLNQNHNEKHKENDKSKEPQKEESSEQPPEPTCNDAETEKEKQSGGDTNAHTINIKHMRWIAAIFVCSILACCLYAVVIAIQSEAYNKGYSSGYQSGETEGNQAGYSSGYNIGYTEGKSKGLSSAEDRYTDGYNDGFKDGTISKDKDKEESTIIYLDKQEKTYHLQKDCVLIEELGGQTNQAKAKSGGYTECYLCFYPDAFFTGYGFGLAAVDYYTDFYEEHGYWPEELKP